MCIEKFKSTSNYSSFLSYRSINFKTLHVPCSSIHFHESLFQVLHSLVHSTFSEIQNSTDSTDHIKQIRYTMHSNTLLDNSLDTRSSDSNMIYSLENKLNQIRFIYHSNNFFISIYSAKTKIDINYCSKIARKLNWRS